MNHFHICVVSILPLLVLSLTSDQQQASQQQQRQQQAYAEARTIRARMGHHAAKKLYQKILKENNEDITAATRLAAGSSTPQRHDAACPLQHYEKIKSLRHLLDDFCYDNNHIQQIFGINPQNKLFKASGPVYVKPPCAGDHCKALVVTDDEQSNNSRDKNNSDDERPEPLQCLVSLFILGIAVPRKTLIRFLGEKSVYLLEDLGLAFPCETNPEYIVPFVHLFPIDVKSAVINTDAGIEVEHSNNDADCSPHCNNLILATDLHPRVLSSTSVGTENHGTVMYIGPDSLALVQHMPLLPFLKSRKLSRTSTILSPPVPLRILDFCAGSGVQALSTLLALPFNKDSNLHATALCVDYNPRALRFTQFNAILNGLTITGSTGGTPQVDVLHADLISGLTIPEHEDDNVRGAVTVVETLVRKAAPFDNDSSSSSQWYDIILANPPFIPVPPNDKDIEQRYGLFSSGGADGEDVLKGIMDISSQVIRPNDGFLAIVSEYMNPPRSDTTRVADQSTTSEENDTNDMALLNRLQRWWSQSKQRDSSHATSGVLFTNENPVDAETYAMRRADSEEMYNKWVKHLFDLTITHVSPGLLFVRTKLKESSATSDNQYSNKLSICHRLVPKSDSGSIWTPSNMEAVEFTKKSLDEEYFWNCK